MVANTFAGTSDGKEVEGNVNSSNFWDRVLRVVDGDRRPSIRLVYAKLEAAKKKIREVSPRYTHLVLDVIEDRWDRQMSRDLHMTADWWFNFGHTASTLRKVVVKILSKTFSSSGVHLH
ncbi:hypothetical protein Taro_027959 [Colocasia esculenta]|uniref:Uncharacterized protein n=1 Tax=Colocasia esculenta TaxID=4460 RepID=A0A843VQC3_COLES|nr:hypothetical protein [Colocasia esculenta]